MELKCIEVIMVTMPLNYSMTRLAIDVFGDIDVDGTRGGYHGLMQMDGHTERMMPPRQLQHLMRVGWNY
ncbi:MAG: hypothetical protein ACJZZ7_05100 [Cytophagales bacterium]